MTHSVEQSNIVGTFLAAEITGSGFDKQVSVSLLPDSKVPFFLAANSQQKAAVTLDAVFVPIQSRSGQYVAGVQEQQDGMPFLGGNSYYGGSPDGTAWGANNGRFLQAGGGTQDGAMMSFAQSAGGFSRSISPNVGYGQNMTTETVLNIPTWSGEIRRTVGMRLPMYAAGAGITVSGSLPPQAWPIAGLGNNSQAINGEPQFDVMSMKAGPVDLRWDDRRQCWCGSDFFSSDIIYGYTTNIQPGDRYNPQTFNVTTLVYSPGTTNPWTVGPVVQCLNLDPNTPTTPALGSGQYIFVVAVRLQSPTISNGSLYVPLYIGCNP